MGTTDNLKEAFAGESQANRRYLAFAEKAEQEGYAQIAKLFRAAADAETIHAHAHLRAMKGIGNTLDNLQTAIAGESFEYQKMYPEFLQAAQAEKEQPAVRSFRNALAVEETHYKLYAQALATLKGGKDLPAASIYVCPVCGHTVVGEVPDTCPVCGTPADDFAEVK
ncbi:MAG TPA: rubrerythrin family protein [Candidatus Methylomirabilis sp.]|nr:rubrerythrin family protein [Candidatus Methylomirabilis sp.]